MILLEKIKKFYYLKILKRRYYRYGKCNMCGRCCKNIYVWHEKKVISSKEEFEKIKNKSSYSFYKHIRITGNDDFGLIFSCDKFDEEKKLCKDHKKRPSICKNYPNEKIFSFGASLYDDCGYSFKPIESFDEVYKKISKKPPKNYETH